MKLQFFDNRQSSLEHPLNQNRGYLFGDGFFTTGIIEKGQLLHQLYHLDRLNDSALRLKFDEFDGKSLLEELYHHIKTVDLACIRITVARLQQTRGYAFSQNSPFNISVQLSVLPDLPDRHCELFFAETPISANKLIAGLKHLNRLDNVLAAQEIRHNFQESLLCLGEQVICGSRSNLFILHNRQWLTPKLEKAGISGITRKRLINAMQDNGIKVKECEITQQRILQCEAALMTNSLVGLWPVARIVNKPLATELSENLKLLLKFKR